MTRIIFSSSKVLLLRPTELRYWRMSLQLFNDTQLLRRHGSKCLEQFLRRVD